MRPRSFVDIVQPAAQHVLEVIKRLGQKYSESSESQDDTQGEKKVMKELGGERFAAGGGGNCIGNCSRRGA